MRVWQQRLKSIKLRDGSFHNGQLELVTWPSRSGRKGWGGVVVEESEEMRNKYLTEFRSDDQKVRPVFRWRSSIAALQVLGHSLPMDVLRQRGRHGSWSVLTLSRP